MNFLLLHGGAGPMSVAGFAALLASSAPSARVLAPAHPGFDGTPRPASLTTVRRLASYYAAQLDELDLDDVCVIGNSIGGWIAAELGLLHSPRVSRLVIVDAVGIEVPGHPVADFFALTFDQVVRLSYADPARFAITPPPSAEENRKTLRVYASAMEDPTLRGRLAGIDVPALVVWGAADGIADPDYGRAFAEAIPGARFVELPGAGHLPQIEAPDRLLKLVTEFATA
jgi:pimeloyl-ACP methyl ester carboxylesterase